MSHLLERPMPRVAPIAAMIVIAVACARRAPPGEARNDDEPAGGSGVALGATGSPKLPDELAPKPVAPAPPAAAKPEPWKGPWLAITGPAAGVYSVTAFDKQKKIGYVRNGGRVPIEPTAVSNAGCSGGWHAVVGGGYVCANLGTTDLEHPQVKFAIKAPDLEAILPYQYARNAKNGTPLYRSVPSREQMLSYEPYLDSKPKPAEPSPAEAEDGVVRTAASSGDAGADLLGTDPDAGAPTKPWWQRDNVKDTLHQVTLEQLAAESDDVLAQRMVTGFYIAVDKTFGWNGRTWYKSTKGLIAPADRFWITAGSKFKGAELDGVRIQLPLAWVYGGRKTAPTYSLDESTNRLKPAKAVDRFVTLQLTGKQIEQGGIRYHELAGGTWIKSIHVRVTQPPPPPADLKGDERWIAVNLKQQTLVAFEGTRPVYATLVSTGKQSPIKEKDHRTPLGQWRVREKHITTTMDGDGSAAGDLPYSIEDVPYVMYYEGSYAVHAAFWHQNFGVQMSHGCVNLAPLDAKHLFFFAEPRLLEGWHGGWSSKERPGSRIVVHE
jgi:lipoprotein-anchoring transpeptidase ErfK/SrfK